MIGQPNDVAVICKNLIDVALKRSFVHMPRGADYNLAEAAEAKNVVWCSLRSRLQFDNAG